MGPPSTDRGWPLFVYAMIDLNANLTPTTELEAVNLCLYAIGQSPVQSLADSGLADVEAALRALHNTSREIQLPGRSFNTIFQSLQARTPEGYLMVPANALQATISRNEFRDGIARGNRMWDRERNTFVWDRDMRMDFVLFLPFNELPQHARNYIAVRAARLFARAMFPDEKTERITASEERAARAEFRRIESRLTRPNAFMSNPELVRAMHRAP